MSSKDDRVAMSVALSPTSFFASQRVSVMYVCFGFSLARLRRARTIDLQCQSLSLRRAFLLRSVCLSLHLTVESFAVRWPTRSQNRSTIMVKIDRKSIPGDTSGHPTSSENRPSRPLRRPCQSFWMLKRGRPSDSGRLNAIRDASNDLGRSAGRVRSIEHARAPPRPGSPKRLAAISLLIQSTHL